MSDFIMNSIWMSEPKAVLGNEWSSPCNIDEQKQQYATVLFYTVSTNIPALSFL